MSTLFPADPRRRCRTTTIEIVAVGIGGVAGAMEIVGQRMRTTRGVFDIHAWAPEIPLLSNATI